MYPFNTHTQKSSTCTWAFQDRDAEVEGLLLHVRLNQHLEEKGGRVQG
jgi:hypothetical protein